MKKAILATKIGMTQVFKDDGTLVPVTVLEAGPCVVTQVKTVENDGYEAVQVGFEDQKASRMTKPMLGHFGKAGVNAKKVVCEFRPGEGETYEVTPACFHKEETIWGTWAKKPWNDGYCFVINGIE